MKQQCAHCLESIGLEYLCRAGAEQVLLWLSGISGLWTAEKKQIYVEEPCCRTILGGRLNPATK